MRGMACLLVLGLASCGVEGPAGPAGPQGDAGEKGDKGDPGEDGTDGVVVSSLFCTGLLENTPLGFSYDAVVMASGDVFSNGAIEADDIEVSQSNYYSVDQVGADDAAVILTFDLVGVANGGYWEIALNRETLVTSITYSDIDLNDGSDVWTMTPDKCIVNTY